MALPPGMTGTIEVAALTRLARGQRYDACRGWLRTATASDAMSPCPPRILQKDRSAMAVGLIRAVRCRLCVSRLVELASLRNHP
jgi:hypothetical protein